MNWYLTKIIFNIVSGAGNHTPQFDEQLRLILAEDMHTAFEKAKMLGSKEEASFLNQHKQKVTWKFVNVAELYPLPDIKDGIEVYSQTHEPDDLQPYINLVERKASSIKTKIMFQSVII